MNKKDDRQRALKFILTVLGVATLLGALAAAFSWASFLVSLWLLEEDK